MRSSAIVAFVTLATVAPAFAAPLSAPGYASYARRATTSNTTPPTTSSSDESGALKLPSLGTIGTIFSLGAPVISGIIDHFKNNGDQQQQQQARELETLLARADVDESGALKLPSLSTLGTIFSLGAPVVSGIIDHFKNNGDQSQQQQARELETLLARADVDESGALKLPSLGTIGTIFSLGAPVISGIIDHFKNNGDQSQQQQARELEALMARADVGDESGALKLPSLSTLGTIFSLGAPVVSGIIDHFKNSGDQSQQQQARELETLLARAEVDESGALKLPSLGDSANIASIGSSLVSVFHNIFGGSNDSQQQRRELLDLLARAEVDESGALKLPSLGDAASIASIGSSLVSVFHNIFGGDSNSQQKRELLELLARAEADESGALSIPSFSDIKDIGSIAGSAFSILHNLLGGSSDSNNQQQRRELAEILARAEVDESGALKLPSLGSILGLTSILGGGSEVLNSIFGGGSSSQQQQRRELMDILARADVDESGALKLPSLGGILGLTSILGGGGEILNSIFGQGSSSSTQQQSRELSDVLAREILAGPIGPEFNILNLLKQNGVETRDVSQSDALSLSSLGSIISVGTSLLGGLLDNIKREELEARFINDPQALRLIPTFKNLTPLSVSTLKPLETRSIDDLD